MTDEEKKCPDCPDQGWWSTKMNAEQYLDILDEHKLLVGKTLNQVSALEDDSGETL